MTTWTQAQCAENFVSGVRLGVSDFSNFETHEMQWGGPPEGFIYFIGIGVPYPSYVKIGFTKGDPQKRLASLQTGCPFQMKMIGFVFGSMPMEQEIHDVLKSYRGLGEWFEYSDYVERIIQDVMECEYL